jgi:hypothetical protein
MNFFYIIAYNRLKRRFCMSTHAIKYLFLVICLILFSCSYNYEEDCTKDCWSPVPPPIPNDDTIGASSLTLWFSAEGGIDSIITEKENWNLQGGIDSGDVSYYAGGEIIKIEGIWLTVDKADKKKVIFSANQNETGELRSYLVFLKSNNYDTKDIFFTSPANDNRYTSIYINQSAE